MKFIAWILKFTKLGKVVEFFDGKKQALAGLATGLAGAATIVGKLASGDDPLAYLIGIVSTPEFVAMSGGFVAFFNALKGEKIRAEIAEVKAAAAPAETSK